MKTKLLLPWTPMIGCAREHIETEPLQPWKTQHGRARGCIANTNCAKSTGTCCCTSLGPHEVNVDFYTSLSGEILKSQRVSCQPKASIPYITPWCTRLEKA
mmetsp:Transcript_26290/g.79796  ORF Transcript_26290/g.79796 Transcript_26290/m.79796 type:complete len:101 (+) Transcript_26290:166-468(+)|eukprot:scaffold25817_cov33-Tisochrysis_lutea.AAC.5